MTCIVNPSRFPTKKSLKERILSGGQVWIEDPSVNRPRSFLSSELQPGEKVTVTNHPKRSWFAQVGRDVDGTLYVK